VIHSQKLPENWLGKNHALYIAAKAARTDWILFTDADVQFHPDSLRILLTALTRRNKTFASVLPEFIANRPFNLLFLTTFALLLSLRIRTFAVHLKWTKSYCGVGAFNLIRRDLYESFGGHAALPLEVADDMVLAKMAMQHGASSLLFNGKGYIRVPWQSDSLQASIRGIEKNAFSGFHYSWLEMIPSLLALFMAGLSPCLFMWNLYALPGWLALIYMFGMSLAYIHIKWIWLAPLYVLGMIFLIYAILRSAILTTLRGEVRWRDTGYRLKELKKRSMF
jgi:glycosyltransferase involved in cell wall biosynthesis